MDGAGCGEVATKLAVPVADGCMVSPSGDVDRILHRTEEEEAIEAKGINVSSDMEDDFLILDEAKVDDEENADRNNSEGDPDNQEAKESAAEGTGVEEGPSSVSSPKAPEAGTVPGDEVADAGESAPPGCEDRDKDEDKEMPEDKDEAEEHPEGKGEAEEHPEGKGEAEEHPEGKGEAEEHPEGKDEAEEHPEGKGEAEEQPEGKEGAEQQPEGKDEAKEKSEDKDGKPEDCDERPKADDEDCVVMLSEEEEDEDDAEKPASLMSLDSTLVSSDNIGEEAKEEPIEEEPMEDAAEDLAEKSFNSSSDDVQVVAVERLADKKPEIKDCPDEREVGLGQEDKKPLLNGAGNADSAAPALKEDPDGSVPKEEGDSTMDSKPLKQLVSSGGRVILADLKRALNVDLEPGKPKRLKLDMGDGEDALDVEILGGGGASVPGTNAVADAAGDAASVSGRDLVMVSRKQLEQYVLRRARSCLKLQGEAVLKPMEKKCDALHSALERWRRRSFQLQRQLNEFICEQGKCTNAHQGRRSVGVCVRMPPLKQPQPPPQPPASAIKTLPTTVTASVVASRPTGTTVTTVASSAGTSPVRPPAPPTQLRVTGTNASMLAAQLGLKPNQHMKLVSVSTPSGGTTTVVTRMPPQAKEAVGETHRILKIRSVVPVKPADGQSALSSSAQLQSAPVTSAAPSTPTSGPVPMQLIANTASLTSSPNQVVKAVTIPSSVAGSPVSGTPIRTVALLQPPGVAGSASPSAVKFIDLTQEEEAGSSQGKVISVSGVSVANAIQKITVPTSSIPVLSAAPTSLVQMPPSSSQGHTRVSIGGTSVVLSPVTGTVSQSGGTVRLNSPLVGPPTRVTYLVPSLPPGMVVTPREVGPPRLAPGGSPQPMQTILLRMASPQGTFTSVPGGAITMGNLVPANTSGGPSPGGPPTMMVATTPSGSQVRMVRAPPPMTLQRAGATTLTLPPGTTLVRGPIGSSPTVRPGTEQVSVVRQPTGGTTTASSSLQLPTVRVHVPKPPTLQAPPKPPTLQAPPKPILQVQVPNSGSAAASKPPPAKPEPTVSLIKHPAPLPPTPRYIDDPKKKRIPPKPSLKISRTPSANTAVVGAVAVKPTAVAKRKPAPSVKKEEPKQPTAEDMEKLVQQWQTYLDSQQGGEDGKKEDSPKEQRRRLPYHAQRPLRQACLCLLGTCRYDQLPVAYKERLHADFGRLESDQQLRVLLGRMYTGGKAKRERQKRRLRAKQGGSAASDAAAGPKGRCKWVYWLPAPGSSTLRRKVCKAAFMGVHGVTEKRTRDVQLLWMRLKAKRGRTPTGDESDIEREELMPGAYTDVEDDDCDIEEKGVESEKKPKPPPTHRPYRGRKILRVSESEGSSSEAADSGRGGKQDDDDEWKPEDEDEEEPPSVKSSSRVMRRALADVKAKTKEPSPEASQDSTAMEIDGGAGEGDDDDDVPYLDISGFEPICSLEEDSENLVLSLPQGLVLSWNMTFNSLYADIQTYQLYAYQETSAAPATSFWKKVGDVRALPLPMACTLTQFVDGHKYHFAVRAVDVHNRLGPFSDPTSILLK